jgi:hypothetical protein
VAVNVEKPPVQIYFIFTDNSLKRTASGHAPFALMVASENVFPLAVFESSLPIF